VIVGTFRSSSPKIFGNGGEPESVKGSATAVDFGMNIKDLNVRQCAIPWASTRATA